MADLSTLFDNFNGAVLDTSKWVAEDAQVAQSGGEIRVTTTLTGIDTGLNSSSPYSMVGNYARCKLVDAGNQALTTVQLRMLRIADQGSSGRLAFFINSGNISALIVNAAGIESTWARQSYVASSYANLQIRERDGTIYWDYSANGFSWANLFSTTIDFGVTNALARFSFESGAEASTTVIRFDDFNIVNSQVSTTKPTITFRINTTSATKAKSAIASPAQSLVRVTTGALSASKSVVKTANLTTAIVRIQVNTTSASKGVAVDNKTASPSKATVSVIAGVLSASKVNSKTATTTTTLVTIKVNNTTASVGVVPDNKTATPSKAVVTVLVNTTTASATRTKTATTTKILVSVKTNNVTCSAVKIKTATVSQSVVRIVVNQTSGQIPGIASGITIYILLKSAIEKNILTNSRIDKFINQDDFPKYQGIENRINLKSQVNNV